MPRFTLRATNDDSSRSIMLAFHSKWHEPIQSKSFSVVFRKFGPRDFTPDWIYAYVAQPVSAIVAKLEVTSYRLLPVADAVKLARKGLLTEEELRTYSARFSTLVVFGIGSSQLARRPVSLLTLKTDYDFWPDSTFIPLSMRGTTTLDELGDFAP